MTEAKWVFAAVREANSTITLDSEWVPEQSSNSSRDGSSVKVVAILQAQLTPGEDTRCNSCYKQQGLYHT
jgi:hypothetical protein